MNYQSIKKLLQNQFLISYWALILAVLCLITLLLHKNITGFSFFSLLFLPICAFISPKICFPIVFLIYGLMYCFDLHILRLYGAPFRLIGCQIMVVTRNTKFHEFIAYFRVISSGDYFRIAIIVLLSISAFIFPFSKHERKNKNKKWLWTKVIFMVVACVGALRGYPYSWHYQFDNYRAIADSFPFLEKQKGFSFGATTSKNSTHNVIICIGEAHRFDFFQKYRKMLPKNSQNPIFWDNMICQGTHTCLCVPQIMSHKEIEAKSLYYHEKSLLALYKEAGYETHVITYLSLSGTDPINFIWQEADSFHQYDCVKYDSEIIPVLKKILCSNSSKRKFIVIKMVGCHYDFESRYPDSYDLLKPSLKNNPKPYDAKYKQLFLNTYDNCFRYSMTVIEKLVNIALKEYSPTLFFFVSDHGFNVFDNDCWFSPPTQGTYHVPYAMWSNKSWFAISENQNMWKKCSDFRNTPLTQHYLFETFVTLSGITHKHYQPDLDLLARPRLPVGKRKVKTLDEKYYFYEDL